MFNDSWLQRVVCCSTIRDCDDAAVGRLRRTHELWRGARLRKRCIDPPGAEQWEYPRLLVVRVQKHGSEATLPVHKRWVGRFCVLESWLVPNRIGLESREIDVIDTAETMLQPKAKRCLHTQLKFVQSPIAMQLPHIAKERADNHSHRRSSAGCADLRPCRLVRCWRRYTVVA